MECVTCKWIKGIKKALNCNESIKQAFDAGHKAGSEGKELMKGWQDWRDSLPTGPTKD